MERKTTIWIFKATIEISHKKTWKWLRKGNLKREILLIAAQNNAIKTNYVKAKNK